MNFFGIHSALFSTTAVPPAALAPAVAPALAPQAVPAIAPQDEFVAAAVAATPREEAAGRATTFGLAIPLVSSALLFGGGMIAAKLFPRPISELFVTIMGTTGVLQTLFKGDVPMALGIFLGGVATLRFIQHADVQPFRKLEKKTVPLESLFNVSRFPTLRSLYGRDATCTQAVDHLSALLRLPEARRFFGFDPDRQNLLDEIGWVRLAETAGLKALGLKIPAGGSFLLPIGVVVAPKDVEVIVHELVHVLHFSIIRKRLTFPDLQRIEAYCRKHELKEECAPFRKQLGEFIQGKEKSPHFIPDDIRHAAAILLFYIGAAQTMGHHEAVPSFLQCRLDPALRRWRQRFLIPFNRYTLTFLFPMAWLGGVTKTAYGFKSLFVYDNPFILRRVLRLGPIDSLLGPNPK